MKINLDLGSIFNNRLAPLANTPKDKIANSHVQTKVTIIDKHNNLQEVKQVLKNSLREHSPQSLNALYQSTQDSRIQVYLGNEEKQVYEIFTDRVTQHINSGKASGESSEHLNSLLQRISQGAEEAHTETRSILAGLGKLDANTESYIAQSNTYTRISLNELAANIPEDEQFAPITSNQKSFSLQVTTREGDNIDINIKQADSWQDTTYGNKISVNYEVEGNLSENEQKALTQLMNAIGSSSDSLLAGADLTQIMGIKNFNGQQLSGFSLALQGSNQDINYSYQHQDNRQTLNGSWSQSGQTKATFDLQSQLGGQSDTAQLARYLDLIDQASEASYKYNDDKQQSDQTSDLFSNTFVNFMKLAETLGESLDSADQYFTQTRKIAGQLFDETIKNQSERLALKDEQQATLKEGFNQLADFSANFVAQRGGVKHQGKQDPQTGYQVELAQKTDIEANIINGELTKAIKQSQTVKFDAVMAGKLNSRTHQFSEQYQIMAAFDETQQLKGYQQSRNSSDEHKETIYQSLGEYRFLEKDKQTLTENSLYLLEDGNLETSEMSGFEHINKGFKTRDVILSQLQFHTNFHYQASQFTPSETSFQNNLQTQLSITSQKQLIDELLAEL